ncbi:cullin-1-like [Coffea arabica]|uniref:Cullin-1-like n=1 Tax=Coffea arabica TaxID=13443 RepID=A0A6P6WLS6_COFAR|nr:cullin-1-like [Coffea arabica]XP_027114647.1 cullin-1-like [Coffea arabica]XP_027114648.1 cullin-1-like [Coffea arabica]
MGHVTVVTLEEGMRRLEVGISKAKLILDGYPPKALFTSEEYMKYYDCVYSMCTQQPPNDYSAELLQRFKGALEESLLLKVLPSLYDKDGAPLLVELLRMWTNYKAMTKCLGVFFLYLDRQCAYRKNDAPLQDLATFHFHDLICKHIHQRMFSAAASLVAQDRNGQSIDTDLLKNISTFFIEIQDQKKASYYDNFETLILADTANFYSRLASQWLLCYSSTDYVLKVEQCINEEKARAHRFLCPPSVEKVLWTVHSQLIDQTANRLIEKRRAENQDLTTYQELLSRCADMSIH